MIRTYRATCSWQLMDFLAEEHHITDHAELEPVEEGVYLYEFSVSKMTEFVQHVIDKINAVEMPCNHLYNIRKGVRIQGGAYANVCDNCGKLLATFPEPPPVERRGIGRRIWFRRKRA